MSMKFNLKKTTFSFPRVKNTGFHTGPPEQGCCPGNQLSRHMHPPRWIYILSIPAGCPLSPLSLEPPLELSLASCLSSSWRASGNTRVQWEGVGNPLPVCIPEIQTVRTQACQTICPQSHMGERQR